MISVADSGRLSCSYASRFIGRCPLHVKLPKVCDLEQRDSWAYIPDELPQYQPTPSFTTSQPVGRLVGRSVGGWLGRSIGRSPGRSVVAHIDQVVGWSVGH